jgi:hypothetical protein
MSQLAYMAFENLSYLDELKYQINQLIKKWLFKKMYHKKYIIHQFESKIKEKFKPKQKY